MRPSASLILLLVLGCRSEKGESETGTVVTTSPSIATRTGGALTPSAARP